MNGVNSGVAGKSSVEEERSEATRGTERFFVSGVGGFALRYPGMNGVNSGVAGDHPVEETSDRRERQKPWVSGSRGSG
jgi:hypothetical protein